MTFPRNFITQIDELADVFVTATEPTQRHNGDSLSGDEVWLDLSVSPPLWKVYDETVPEWTTIGASGGGGGGGLTWGDPILAGNGPGGGQDDEFDDDTVAGAWTTVAPTGTATLSESGDVMSLLLEGQSTSDLAAAVKAISGTPSAPTTIEVALRWLSLSLVVFSGLVFSNGTSATSNAIFAGYVQSSGNPRIAFREGTFTNLATETEIDTGPSSGDGAVWSPWLHMKMIWSAANTFQLEISPDGVSWLTFASRTFSLTPTHYGIAGSTWGGNDQIITAEYFRVS